MFYLFFAAIVGLNADAANLTCQMSSGISGIAVEGTKIFFDPVEKTLTHVFVAKDPLAADVQSAVVSGTHISALKIKKTDSRCSLSQVEDGIDYKMTFVCKDYDEYSEINISLNYSKTTGSGYYSELRFKKTLFGIDYKEIELPFMNCM